MNHYLILVRGTVSAFLGLDDASRRAIFQKFGFYMERLPVRAQRTGGIPLERLGRHVQEGQWRDLDASVEGYMFLQAENYYDAITKLDDCPSIEIGGKLRIRELDQRDA